MASHRLQVAVAPLEGAASTTFNRIDGNGRSQTKLVVLDELFVEVVRQTYRELDLTDVIDITSAIWVGLFSKPSLRHASLTEIEAALIYLSDADEILLPTSLDEA